MINDREGLKQRPEPSSLSLIKPDPGSSQQSNKSTSAQSDDFKNDAGSIAAAAFHAAAPTWANMVLMVSLIFGGCCANVSTRSSLVDRVG